MPIIGRAIMPLFIPKKKLYLIKDGSLQGSYGITCTGLKPTSSSSLNAAAPNRTDGTGYIQIEARGTGTYQGAGIAYVSTKVDLSQYSTLHIVGTAKNGTGNNGYLAVQAWTAIGSYQNSNRVLASNVFSSSASSYTSVDKSINVSSYTSNAFIGISVARYNSVSSAFRIVDLYLD